MTESTAWTIVIVGSVLIAIIARKVVGLRVRVLRKLHLNGLADWHERNVDVIVIVVRIVTIALAVYGLTQV